MKSLHHPDTVLTASDLETVAVGLLSVLPLSGVEGLMSEKRFESQATRMR
jgi:hypothetical protein